MLLHDHGIAVSKAGSVYTGKGSRAVSPALRAALLRSRPFPRYQVGPSAVPEPRNGSRGSRPHRLKRVSLQNIKSARLVLPGTAV